MKKIVFLCSLPPLFAATGFLLAIFYPLPPAGVIVGGVIALFAGALMMTFIRVRRPLTEPSILPEVLGAMMVCFAFMSGQFYLLREIHGTNTSWLGMAICATIAVFVLVWATADNWDNAEPNHV